MVRIDRAILGDVVLLILVFLVASGYAPKVAYAGFTPTPTPSPTPTATPTPRPAPTALPQPTPSPTTTPVPLLPVSGGQSSPGGFLLPPIVVGLIATGFLWVTRKRKEA